MACHYVLCSWPLYPIPPGSYVFPFSVVEYKRWATDLKDPNNYGFIDSGTWTLIVNNQRPVVTVSPTEVKVNPGDTVAATVTATDPDGDRITLTKISGPESFPQVTGKGSVSGEYIWTVPEYYAYGPGGRG